MNAELAQLVCLATYGRRWLAAPYAEWPPDPHLGNTTFRHVSTVRFDGGGGWTDVPSWLEGLRDRGAKALWLAVDAQWRESMPFLNGHGGTWGLVARTESGQELWRPLWEAGAPGARDGRAFTVRYLGEGANVAVPAPPLDGAEAALVAALDESEAYAREVGAPEWAEWFARARAAGGDVPVAPGPGPRGLPRRTPPPPVDGGGGVGVRRDGLVERRRRQRPPGREPALRRDRDGAGGGGERLSYGSRSFGRQRSPERIQTWQNRAPSGVQRTPPYGPQYGAALAGTAAAARPPATTARARRRFTRAPCEG